MDEASWRRNHGVAEGESLRRHLEGIWEASGRHLGGIWEASGKHLGSIWEASGRHLGGIWGTFGRHLETSGRMEAEEASGGQISYFVPHSATECKSSIKMSISRRVFEGTINYDCIFTVRYGCRLFHGDGRQVKGPLPTP